MTSSLQAGLERLQYGSDPQCCGPGIWSSFGHPEGPGDGWRCAALRIWQQPYSYRKGNPVLGRRSENAKHIGPLEYATHILTNVQLELTESEALKHCFRNENILAPCPWKKMAGHFSPKYS